MVVLGDVIFLFCFCSEVHQNKCEMYIKMMYKFFCDMNGGKTF